MDWTDERRSCTYISHIKWVSPCHLSTIRTTHWDGLSTRSESPLSINVFCESDRSGRFVRVSLGKVVWNKGRTCVGNKNSDVSGRLPRHVLCRGYPQGRRNHGVPETKDNLDTDGDRHRTDVWCKLEFSTDYLVVEATVKQWWLLE